MITPGDTGVVKSDNRINRKQSYDTSGASETACRNDNRS